MIQFNLLPDVKVDYMKASRTKRLVMMAAIAVTSLAVFIFILLFLIVNVFQKQHLNNLNDDIKSTTAELEGVQDLDKVLTVQNQLNSLTELHDGKPAASRLYTYLVQLTPQEAKISQVKIDFTANTIDLTGSAKSLEVVNKFTDTLKFTDYKTESDQKKGFSEVVLSSFAVAKATGDKDKTSYMIKLKFDPVIFDSKEKVELVVPNIISTRSVTEKPSDLFEAKQETGN